MLQARGREDVRDGFGHGAQYNTSAYLPDGRKPGYNHSMQASVLLFVVMFFSQFSWAEISFLDEAQIAASEGRFDDVISILSNAIDSDALEEEERAIAFSNRGIAFSLLKRFGPAMQDLRMAIELQPDHLLTLNHLGILAEHVALDFEEAALWYEKAAALLMKKARGCR